MHDEATKSARAADDQENSQEVCCIAVKKEPGTVVGHLPWEGVTCALCCIDRNYTAWLFSIVQSRIVTGQR